MGIVHTDKIKRGMVLADEVRDINGRLLLAKGKTIQPEHIRIFKIWGITEVTAIGGGVHPETPAAGTVDPDLLEKIREKTEYIFTHTDLEHPAVKEIFKLAVTFRSQNNRPDTDNRLLVTGSKAVAPNTSKDILQKLVDKDIVLPEIPSIVFELNEVIANPLSSADHIAQVVNKSPSLTALLLRIVNSSFYGLPSQVDKVSLAVTLIGTREVSALALGISIISIFKNIPKDILNMHYYLRHSLACGIVSRIIAAHKNLRQTEQLFVSGLLHDLGRLIMYIYFPDESLKVLNRATASLRLLYEEENELLGYDHAEVGRHLLKQWKLPLVLENNVLYHHKPSEAQQCIPATIVHLADIMVNALGIGSSGERFVPPLDTAAWQELDLPPSCFEVVIRQATHQFSSLESILEA